MEENRYLQELTDRCPALKGLEEEIRAAYGIIKESFQAGGKLLVAGNGGSCADAEHIVGELMKSFVKPRPVPKELKEALIRTDSGMGGALSEKLQQGLPAIALNSHPGLTSAFLNDVDGEMAYAQQVLGYGKKGDVFLGITTSGNAKNIRCAAVTAKAMGLRVIGLTGRDGGTLRALCDAAVIVPEQETYRIQELHLPIYHTLCLMLEEAFF
ncbi:SIS domain-containing protein [Clostridiaceae bacterium]|nr:SIS domain-containing protein [Clostridium sp.]NBI71997.1 SIS domain-containing protein [Clostridiaceae bacterium]